MQRVQFIGPGRRSEKDGRRAYSVAINVLNNDDKYNFRRSSAWVIFERFRCFKFGPTRPRLTRILSTTVCVCVSINEFARLRWLEFNCFSLRFDGKYEYAECTEIVFRTVF